MPSDALILITSGWVIVALHGTWWVSVAMFVIGMIDAVVDWATDVH